MKAEPSVEFKEAVLELRKDVLRLRDLTDESMEDAFFEIGAILKRQIENVLPRSTREEDSRKGVKRKHHHLKDDVKYWVGLSKKSQQRYVSAFGGKDTGYKWGWINDGHVDKRTGNFIPGIHFLEKALDRSENMIEGAIDDALEKVVKE